MKKISDFINSWINITDCLWFLIMKIELGYQEIAFL